jgi:hypothetical protein
MKVSLALCGYDSFGRFCRVGKALEAENHFTLRDSCSLLTDVLVPEHSGLMPTRWQMFFRLSTGDIVLRDAKNPDVYSYFQYFKKEIETSGVIELEPGLHKSTSNLRLFLEPFGQKHLAKILNESKSSPLGVQEALKKNLSTLILGN